MTEPESEIVRRIAAQVAGTRLAAVIGPSVDVCGELSEAGMKVLCVVAGEEFRQFCLGAGGMLYASVFPVIGDHRKAARAFPMRLDLVFFGVGGGFNVRDWLGAVRRGGAVAGLGYQLVRGFVGPANHARGVWWRDRPGREPAKCAWELMPDGGSRYLQSIAASMRVGL
jgi:hypothetical protein